jgi:hypothetical protein
MLPKSLTTVGQNAFYSLNLDYIFYPGTEKDWLMISGIDYAFLVTNYNKIHYEATDHPVAISAAVAPTCTNKGYIKYVCANGCGHSYVEYNQLATGHDYGDTLVVIKPTCTEEGCKYETCIKCGHVNSFDWEDPTGHNYVEVGKVVPTCTTQGYTIYQCTGCNDTKNDDYIDASGNHQIEKTDTYALYYSFKHCRIQI